MKRALYGVAALGLVMVGAAGALAVSAIGGEDVIRPAELTATEIAGAIFDHPEVVVRSGDDRTTHDFITHLSSDKNFVSGIYRATEGHWTERAASDFPEVNYSSHSIALTRPTPIPNYLVSATSSLRLGPGPPQSRASLNRLWNSPEPSR